MKIRNGFVSNSSSSSFIVIVRSQISEDDFKVFSYDYDDKFVVNGSHGTTEFGWGPATITDAWSRLNFSYLQALYAKREDWIKMIEDLLEKRCGISKIEWRITLDYNSKCNSYIDHQSCATEGANTMMFDSDRDLEAFIFGRDSYIVLDNDNGDDY